MDRNHLTHCAVALVAALGLLLAFGVDATSLLTVGVLLVCPLMMLVMMRSMMTADGHGAGCSHDHGEAHEPAAGAPTQATR